MIYRLISISFLFLFINMATSTAQNFKGMVVDEETGAPVPHSTIFLTNTTLGVSADQNAEFSMEIPNGNYEVVVRMIGYELLVFTLRTEEMGPSYLIKLKPDIAQLPDIKVESERDKVWHRNLKIFQDYFVGTSERARKCTLLNPEVLVLDAETTPGILTANASEVLKIYNPELGYEISYILVDFKLDSIKGEVFFQGYPSYQNLPKYKSKLPRRIVKNRENAYKGSIRHFLKCVYDRNADSEGFLVRQVQKLPNPERPSDQKIAEAKARISQAYSRSEKDSLYRNYLSKESLPRTIYDGDTSNSDTEEFISRLDDGKVILQFENYLEVSYTKQREEMAYTRLYPYSKTNSQVSILKMNVPHTAINYQGVTYNPFDIFYLGYMGWEKMGDMMPIDYQP